MQVVRGVRQSHGIDDGVDTACGGSCRSTLGEIGRKDLGVLHLAEGAFKFLARAPDHAERDAAPLELSGRGGPNGARRAEDRNFLHLFQGTSRGKVSYRRGWAGDENGPRLERGPVVIEPSDHSLE